MQNPTVTSCRANTASESPFADLPVEVELNQLRGLVGRLSPTSIPGRRLVLIARARGFPPFTCTVLTSPSVCTSTSSLTAPLKFMPLASCGYEGKTLLITLRLVVCSSWAKEALGWTLATP